MAVDPEDPLRLVAWTDDNPYHDTTVATGVWVSADGGTSWRQANAGLHMLRIADVAFDPHDPERLVLGTGGGGFYRGRWPRTQP